MPRKKRPERIVFESIAIRVALPPEATSRLFHEGVEAPTSEPDLLRPRFEEGEPFLQVLTSKKPHLLPILQEDELASLPNAEFLADGGGQSDLALRADGGDLDHGTV